MRSWISIFEIRLRRGVRQQVDQRLAEGYLCHLAGELERQRCIRPAFKGISRNAIRGSQEKGCSVCRRIGFHHVQALPATIKSAHCRPPLGTVKELQIAELARVADNLSADKAKLVDDFLARHPQVRIHFAPTFSSWLNQVENLVRQDTKTGHRPRHFFLPSLITDETNTAPNQERGNSRNAALSEMSCALQCELSDLISSHCYRINYWECGRTKPYPAAA